jgi:hypothetical protein
VSLLEEENHGEVVKCQANRAAAGHGSFDDSGEWESLGTISSPSWWRQQSEPRSTSGGGQVMKCLNKFDGTGHPMEAKSIFSLEPLLLLVFG